MAQRRNKIFGLIREPLDVDFTIKSEPWTEDELIEFRKIMNASKKKAAKSKRHQAFMAKYGFKSNPVPSA